MNKPATPPVVPNRPSLHILFEGMARVYDHTEADALFESLEAKLVAAEQEQELLKKLLKASENWRKAYQEGKEKMYGMGGDVAEAAIDYLPCNEGSLDRLGFKAIGYPKIRDEVIAAAKLENELVAANQRADEAFNDGIEAAATYLIDKWGAVSLAKRVWGLSKRPTPSPDTGGTE